MLLIFLRCHVRVVQIFPIYRALVLIVTVFSVARAQVPALAVELNNGVKMRMLGLGTTDSSDTLAAGAVYEAIRAG
ncbi:hypothetical protein FOZ60_013239 [Perkinsus olseni]|uniref:Uncharacterized protein n=1 Tax=Perkinsus olseni TaxID=32597 RepID=A0A7J6N9M2_PEROL|nr:hypothetical protein FOZ60_013239 [Perkinsus olseni]